VEILGLPLNYFARAAGLLLFT